MVTTWQYMRVVILQALLLSIFSFAENSCIGVACGNKQLPKIGFSSSRAAVTFLVFSVWVGDTPLNVQKLNHKVYCDANGYEYRHFYFNHTEFAEKYTRYPAAWMSVYAARELLETSKADYFFKMDIDCLFLRTDVRLESLIDPLQRYSFYTTNTVSTDRFMQSQSWILKNSEFSTAFIREWLEYVHWGNCGDLAYEQGAMHLTIGTFYKYHLGANGTDFTCPHACNSARRSAYHHHHCVLDWLTDNGFGMEGSMNTHPHIYVYPYHNATSYSSPDDGFFLEHGEHHRPMPAEVNPLTVHPFKKHIYSTPQELTAFMRSSP